MTGYGRKTGREDAVNRIRDDIINFWAGSKLPADYTDEQRECMAEYERKWNDVEIDAEGPNAGQDKELDEIELECAAEVYELGLTWDELGYTEDEEQEMAEAIAAELKSRIPEFDVEADCASGTPWCCPWTWQRKPGDIHAGRRQYDSYAFWYAGQHKDEIKEHIEREKDC